MLLGFVGFPLRDLALLPAMPPIIWPKAIAERAIWHVEQEAARPTAEIPKIWADHVASVADYWRHKQRHPDAPAGAMVILHSWARYIPVVAAVVTLNPIVIVIAVIDAQRRSNAGQPIWKGVCDSIAWRVSFL